MKAAVVIPVFNHAASIARVIDDVHAATAGLPEIHQIVVVDDGCTDATPEILKNIPHITVLTHPKNRGKGAALLTAFRHLHAHGFAHAITIDADGQHDTADIAPLLAAARQHPDDVIIGSRNMDAPQHNYRLPRANRQPKEPDDRLRPIGNWRSEIGTPVPIPRASKTGRKISRFWLRIETGQDIPDSQCGLRIYPLAHVLKCRYRFHHYDFETEVLARMAWAGLQIHSVPAACIYFPRAKRVSHFRPIIDTLRGVCVNADLVMRRLLPVPLPRSVAIPAPAPQFGRWWKLDSWRSAIRQALQAGSTNADLAAAFALGVLVGITPFYLLQTLLVIYLARRLHLNILAAVVGSQISIPPLAPVWLALSYGIGNLLLHGQWINLHSSVFSLQALPVLLVGCTAVSTGSAAIALLLARIILSRIRPEPAIRHAPAFAPFAPAAGNPIATPPT